MKHETVHKTGLHLLIYEEFTDCHWPRQIEDNYLQFGHSTKLSKSSDYRLCRREKAAEIKKKAPSVCLSVSLSVSPLGRAARLIYPYLCGIHLSAFSTCLPTTQERGRRGIHPTFS